MSRIRSIKPEFWTSEQVLECSPITRLMFVGMWNFADDAGRMPCSPKSIKAQVFPGDDISFESIRGMLNELSANGLILIYSIEDKEYLQITGWHHQRIDKPRPAKYPAPFFDDSGNAPRTIPPDTIGEERKGKDIRAVAKRRAPAGNRFDEFWSEYPRRDGSNPKAAAKKIYDAAIKSGADEQSVIDGAKRYRAMLRAKSQEGSQYVAQAVTWLRQSRWGDDLPSAQPEKPKPDWDVTMRAYTGGRPGMRTTWAWGGAEPGNSGCLVPPEIQRKYGFEPAAVQERSA